MKMKQTAKDVKSWSEYFQEGAYNSKSDVAVKDLRKAST